ncbi:MAG: hypothetical protein HYY43_00900, partial [Deltaproteobacteria bacterium]|nr:hypothetical protein [Deltaproteobacteria bacterium]
YFYVGGGIATVDVYDVVEGHIRAWKKGRTGERYILANENLTFKEISDVIMEVMEKPQNVCHSRESGNPMNIRDPHFRGDDRRYCRFKIPFPIILVFAYLATWFSKLTGTKPVATIPMAKFTRVNLFFSNEKSCQELGMTFRPFRESIERAVEWFREHNYL